MNIRNLLVPAAIAVLSSAAFAQTILFSDNFDGAAVRTSGDSVTPVGVYDSNGQWYANLATNQSVGTLDGAAMRFKGNSTVAKQFTSVDVSATNYVQIDFDFMYNVAGTSQFTIGLFDSQYDSRFGFPELSSAGVISNGSSGVFAPNSSQPYMAWGGYYFLMAAGSTSSSTLRLREHAAVSTGIMTSSAQNVIGLTGGTDLNAVSGGPVTGALLNTVFHMTYRIDYVDANTLTLSSVLTSRATGLVVNSMSANTTIEGGLWDDGVMNAVDTNGSPVKALGSITFDTILLNAGSSPTLTMDNVLVTTNIPEPATYAACLGALSLLVVGYRRFRR